MGGAPPLRVATYNVHGCVGRDGRHDPGRVAEVIAQFDADIVALQEFTYPLDVALETRTLAEMNSLGHYQCALGPTRQTVARRFGNALLTRHKILEVRRLDLSMQHREPRGAIAATIMTPGAPTHVLAAHLGLRVSERRFQLAQILAYLEGTQNGMDVVMGDFNDWLPGRSVVHVLDARMGRPPTPRSFPAAWPVLSLDRIWVQPRAALARVWAHRTPLARVASDHLPVVADLQPG